MLLPDTIKIVDPAEADMAAYSLHLADCVVLTHDNKLLMQQRPLEWRSFPGFLTTFGGHVEPGETSQQGLIRELREELGANVRPEDLILLGGVTEAMTQHQELIHVYFWHDAQATITGCYEAAPRRYDHVREALAHPKLMDYARWALEEAFTRKLLRQITG